MGINSKCHNPEVGACLIGSQDSEEASKTRAH